jgi:glycosyltransferase involved in cell wall biosynthesis
MDAGGMNQPLKIFVHLGYGQDAYGHREQYLAGRAPDEVPYGYHHAEKMGCVVEYSRDFRESRVANLFRRSLARILGFDPLHAWRNRRGLLGCDVVWTMTEQAHLAAVVLFAFYRPHPRPKLIAHSVWLFDHWSRFSWVRKRLYCYLLQGCDVLTVHSDRYLPIIAGILPRKRSELMRFGISLDSFPFTPVERPRPAHSPLRVLSMGYDRTRDWQLLLDAFGDRDAFELVVVSPRLPKDATQKYRNLKAPTNPTMQECREMYRWADLVVIPMVPNLYSGITVALEATSLGVPVIATAAGGVPTYFSAEEVCFVPPGSADKLREAALTLAQDDARRYRLVHNAQAVFLRDELSTEGLARRYVRLSRELLAQ